MGLVGCVARGCAAMAVRLITVAMKEPLRCHVPPGNAPGEKRFPLVHNFFLHDHPTKLRLGLAIDLPLSRQATREPG